MDFDPRGAKWQCCCCSLPSGLQILSTAEVLLCTVVAAATAFHVKNDPQGPSLFEICLILVMISMSICSGLLLLGIHRHRPSLMYPTIIARGLLIAFVQEMLLRAFDFFEFSQVFGVSTVVSPGESRHVEVKQRESLRPKGAPDQQGVPNVALRLVLLVFGMLFITVLIVYCIYLILRAIRYETAFARLKERRASLIHAGMIDPDFGSRRASNA